MFFQQSNRREDVPGEGNPMSTMDDIPNEDTPEEQNNNVTDVDDDVDGDSDDYPMVFLVLATLAIGLILWGLNRWSIGSLKDRVKEIERSRANN
jgi:hypothetical protein